MTELTLILGANRRWKEHTGGKWVRSVDDRGTGQWKMHPAIHKLTLTEPQTDGLLSLAQKWKDKNTEKEQGAGDIRRMVKVEIHRRNFEADPPKPAGPPIISAIDRLARGIGDSILEAIGIAPKANLQQASTPRKKS